MSNLPLLRNTIMYPGEIKQFRRRTTTSANFPFWLLSAPNQILNASGQSAGSNYPDYVEYLRSVVAEVPFTATALPTTTGTPSNTSTLSFTSGYTATPSHVGMWVAILDSANPSVSANANFQYRIITSSSANQITIDVPVSMSSGYTVWLLDHNSTSTDFTGTCSNNNSLVLNDNVLNRNIFSALYDDYAFGFRGDDISTDLSTQWGMVISISPGSTWNEGTAVERIITGITCTTNANRTITFSGGALNSTQTFRIFPHRVLGQNGQARHRQILDTHLGVGGLEIVTGLRRRDRMQGHRHSINDPGHSHPFAIPYGHVDSPTNDFRLASSTNVQGNHNANTNSVTTGITVTNPSTDTTNGSPRTDQFNQPRTLGVYLYESVGRIL